MTSGFSQSSAGFLANHMARLFERGLRQRLAELGIAPAQFMVLVELWHEDGLTQSGLTERLAVEQATMANTLARMERDGLILRPPHPEDGRARQVRLTDRARRLEAPSVAAARQVNALAFSGIPEDEQAEFLTRMRHVIGNLQKRL